MTGPARRVDCVVPAYNSEAFIARALDSIAAQTHDAIDTIVADGGSSDGTVAIARAHPLAPRVVELDQATPPATRNAGLAATAAPLIAFLDADDMWLPDKIATQLAFLDANPDHEACVTLARNVWQDDLGEEAAAFEGHWRAGPIAGYATITLLARRSIFQKIGAFREELWFSDATDWFVRVAEAGVKIGLVPEVLVHRRMHRSNLTRRLPDGARDEILNVVKRSRDHRRRDDGVTDFSGLPRFRGANGASDA